jgi:hypothetical protein
LKTLAKLTIERYFPVPAGHLADPNGPPDGRLIVEVVQAGRPLGDFRLAVPCWTVGTTPSDLSAPVLVPQYRRGAYALGQHGRGAAARLALVNQGNEPVELLRADGTRVAHVRPYRPEDWRGINIHSRIGGVSNGCPTLLDGDMDTVLSFCHWVEHEAKLPLEGQPRHRKDGRLLWDFEVVDCTRSRQVNILPKRG